MSETIPNCCATFSRLLCAGARTLAPARSLPSDLRAHPADDARLEAAIRAAVARKPRGHDFDYARQSVTGQVSRHMSHTGG